MRGVFFCSIAFAANAAVASVCKPRPRSSDTSALLLSSSTTQDVTTTTLLAVPSTSASAPISSDGAFTSLSEGTTTTSDLLLPTTIYTVEETSATTGTASGSNSAATITSTTTLEIPISDITTDTTTIGVTTASTNPTTATTLEDSTSTETSATVGTATTATQSTTSLETTTTATVEETTSSEATTTTLTPTTSGTVATGVTTTAIDTLITAVSTVEEETTTTADFTTTTSQGPFQPLPTFDLVGIGSPTNSINGQRVSGTQVEYNYIGWNREPAEPIIHFTLEPETGYLKASESNLYMCVFVASDDPLFYNQVFICSEAFDDFQIYRRITCEQTPHGKLSCSAPATSCVVNQNTFEFECTDLGRNFDTFYSSAYYGLLDLISFGYSDEAPVGTEVHPVELGIVAPMLES